MSESQPTEKTHTHAIGEMLGETVAYLDSRLAGRRPALGLILGSGLGAFANTLDNPIVIDYDDIPHFMSSTVTGHAGRLVVGDKQGVTCVAMQGRLHPYEGYEPATVAFPTRVMIRLGAGTLIITNAAGSVNPDWAPGTLMLISDHINLTGRSPLRGPNPDDLGPRFPDMTNAYHPDLRTLARAAGERMGLTLREGVYTGLPGPAYETPAEIRMVRAIGGDAVGMSTVFEVLAARHMGARVLGISCLTNLAAGLQDKELDHSEVTEIASKVRVSFQQLLDNIIGDLQGELASQPAAGGSGS